MLIHYAQAKKKTSPACFTLDIGCGIIELANENLDNSLNTLVVEVVVGLQEFGTEIVGSHESMILIIGFGLLDELVDFRIHF